MSSLKQCMYEDNCEDGFAYNFDSEKCVSCPYHCEGCYHDVYSTKMACHTCEDDYFYNNGICVNDNWECKDGGFYNYSSGICESCGNHCNYCDQNWFLEQD